MQWLDLLFTDEGITMQDLGEKGYTWDDADEGALGVDGSPAVYKKIDPRARRSVLQQLLVGPGVPRVHHR